MTRPAVSIRWLDRPVCLTGDLGLRCHIDLEDSAVRDRSEAQRKRLVAPKEQAGSTMVSGVTVSVLRLTTPVWFTSFSACPFANVV